MKNRLIYLGTAFLLLFLCFGFQYLNNQKVNPRRHQHRETKEIPTIRIQTNNQEIQGDVYYERKENATLEVVREDVENITVDFQYEDEEGANVSTDAWIHIRGNSSRWFEKKSYLLHLVDKKENPVMENLANMGEYNEWILNGPYLDKTLIRNYMCMNIAGEIMDYAPEVAYVDLYIDDEYQGLYVLMESVSHGENRLNLKDTSAHSYVTSYIVNRDRNHKRDVSVETFSEYTYKTGGTVFGLEYPGTGTYTDAKLDYIKNDLSKIEKKLYSYDLKTYHQDFADDIDMQSFADYFIINEFFGNTDAGFYSTYFYKDVRGKLKTCVWDFNNACDNYMEKPTEIGGFHMRNTPWFEQLIKDDRFVERVIRSYHKYRKTVLSDEYLQQYITDTTTWLGDKVEQNYEVWGDSWHPENYPYYEKSALFLSPLTRNPKDYDEAVDSLRTYISKRGKWLDKHIDSLQQYCKESRIVNETLQ